MSDQGLGKRPWSPGGEKLHCAPPAFFVFFFLFIIIIIIIYYYYSILFYFQLLNCSYLDIQVLLLFSSPLHQGQEKRKGVE